MSESFAERLTRAVEALGPLCVGIDPSPALLHAWGLDDDAGGVEYVARRVIESMIGVIAVVKPQVAFFERFGSAGYLALERALDDARSGGLLTIGDAKRGDISTSAAAYADAWLDAGSPLRVDALTVSPYLGVGALGPVVERARHSGRGVFVVAGSSNEEGVALQSARTGDGVSVEALVVDEVRALGTGAARGAVGVVIGATREHRGVDLRDLPGAILVPGVGAQGASVEDAARATRGARRASVLISVSRAVLAVGPERRVLAREAARWRDEAAGILL